MLKKPTKDKYGGKIPLKSGILSTEKAASFWSLFLSFLHDDYAFIFPSDQ